MDRDEALKLLRGGEEGIREWNRRRKEGEEAPDFSGAHLIDANLTPMPSEPDKTKRWQFSLRDLFVLMFLVILPIVVFMLAEQLDSLGSFPMLFFASVFMGGGVFGGVVGWLCAGTRRGFWWGYGICGPCFWFCGFVAKEPYEGIIP